MARFVSYCLIFVLLFAARAGAGDIVSGKGKVSVKSGYYAIHVPAGYDAEKKWPLIVWLHGSGNEGEDNRDMWVNILSARSRLGEFIVLVPNQEWMHSRKSDEATDYKVILESLDDVLGKYSIDPKRVLLSSHSGGGPPSQKLIVERAKQFTAYAPWSNNFHGWSGNAKNLGDMPVLLMWGEKDHELIVASDGYGVSGEGPSFHKAACAGGFPRYQRKIMVGRDHAMRQEIGDEILKFYDEAMWENSLSKELRAVWDDIRALRLEKARKTADTLAKKSAPPDGLNVLQEKLDAVEKALAATVAGAPNALQKAVWLKIAVAACGKSSEKGREYAKQLKEAEADKSLDKAALGAIAAAFSANALADGKARSAGEEALRKHRASSGDDAVKSFCEECINRLWQNSLGLGGQ